MRIFQAIKNRSLRIRPAMRLSVAMFLAPFAVFGQELGEPFPGAEILPDTVQIEHNSRTACALRTSGEVFCWARNLSLRNVFDNTFPESTDFLQLNSALNNDIASITLSGIHLCGIGRVSGVACVFLDRPSLLAFRSIENPPEPNASYLSISDFGTSTTTNVCAIQTDNRVVCWGADGSNVSINDIPPEASFLQQVDIEGFRACGIDLNNAVVCWSNPSLLPTDVDQQFGDVDIATIGPAKQISMGMTGACIIDMNDRLECFGQIANNTEIFADQSFSNITIDRNINTPVLCYETTSGEKDCETLAFLQNSPATESLFPPDADVRLFSVFSSLCYVTTDGVMKCTTSDGLPDQNQFPTAPQNLSVELFSETQGELSWSRPSASSLSDEFATGYEIFRDGVLIDRLPVVTSYFDSNTNPTVSYEVRATRGLIAGASSFVNADGSDGTGLPTEPSPPTTPTAPPTAPVDDNGLISLTGTVYSSTALELFYNPTRAGSSALRYNIFRDGELIRGDSPATSQFEAGLDVNTSYFYEVQAVLDGNIISTDSVTLTTFDDGSGIAPTTPVNNPVSPSDPTTPLDVTVTLSGAVYSSTALELFWNRSSVSGVTYNIFRDGVLIRANSPAISQFEAQLPPNNTFLYEVEAVLDGATVASDSIAFDTSTGLVFGPDSSGPLPPTTGPQQPTVAPIELIGAVFSSTALELSWNRDVIPGVTYDIFRDGELIRGDSPAISQFESGLLPNTSYLYTVTPRLNGVEQASETIELSTLSI